MNIDTLNHSQGLIGQQPTIASEHSDQFVFPAISVSDMHGRQSKVPVPLVIITFQRTQESMAAVNTPPGVYEG